VRGCVFGRGCVRVCVCGPGCAGVVWARGRVCMCVCVRARVHVCVVCVRVWCVCVCICVLSHYYVADSSKLSNDVQTTFSIPLLLLMYQTTRRHFQKKVITLFAADITSALIH
jgi:hypothetical protein